MDDITWLDRFPCLVLPAEEILFKVKVIEEPKSIMKFSILQMRKEKESLRDVIDELKEKFKEKKE
ncbi:MAG: hypothetical protein ACFFG0_23690 [Candidatus Thorarchaeota archaeon]